MPIAMAEVITTYEDFENSSWENSTVSYSNVNTSFTNGYSGGYGCTDYCLYASFNGNATMTVDWDDDYVEELGFKIGAVNATFNLKYNYTDGTNDTTGYTFNNNTGSGWSDYDINFSVGDSGKFVDSIEISFANSDVVLIDDIYWTYDSTTSATTTTTTTSTTTTTVPLTIGDPTNLTVSANLHNGSINVDWDAPTDGNTSPERYAIGFDKADPPMYAVATGNVGDANALNTEYTFTKAYLQSALDAQVGDTLYFKIRSDNDTNSLYSSWTTIASYTIPNAPSGVTNVSITNNEYQGLKIGWVQPNTGWGTVSSYTISYKLSSEETYTDIENIDVNATSYLIENIAGGTYDFVVYACSSTGWCHGQQSGPTTNYEVLSTTATTTTTTTTTLPPPPPPAPEPEPEPEPEKIVVVMDDGTEAEYTETEIADGTSERDNERKANEEKWGCYVTNIALERGDCEEYNKAIAEPEEEIVEEEVIDDKVIEDEIKDEEIVEEIIEDDTTDDIVDDIVVEDDKTEEIVDEVKITTTTTVPKVTTTTTQPIKEDFVDEDIIEEEILDIEVVISEELTEEGIEKLVDETEDLVNEIVIVEIEEAEINDNMTEDEIASAQEKFEEAIEEVVKELPTEKKVEVVKEVAKVKVQTLASADNKTKAVVKAVVKEVTKTETVAQLSEEEKKDVGKVLGFQDETAADDVEIIAVQAEKEPAVAEAVAEYVDRAIENKDVENYTLADVITEVQVENFLENPVGSLLDVDFSEISISTIGYDMTSDQKEKAQEVVVPVILASQIIAQAGALMTRRF